MELAESAARIPAEWNVATGNFLRRCESCYPCLSWSSIGTMLLSGMPSTPLKLQPAGNWSRADVYDRLTPKGRKPQLSTLVITQVVSGLWHGIFPGYALFFLSLAFFFNSSKVCLLAAVQCTQCH